MDVVELVVGGLLEPFFLILEIAIMVTMAPRPATAPTAKFIASPLEPEPGFPGGEYPGGYPGGEYVYECPGGMIGTYPRGVLDLGRSLSRRVRLCF